MKRVLGLLLTLAVMVAMTMPAFAQEKGKAEAKKGAPAAEKRDGKNADAKKKAAKSEKKAEKADKKTEKKAEKK